ncbi:hypothetical protein [Halobacteriovorax sp. HLS]|uniref:hypothetical protein n=1 Tax=Halobacteriovorax sp. HLS TaxID=2234000 RepID=UPI000FDAF6CA|nr:hypothetical protein [Halobacteriovorax sp. HLS]
MKKISTFLAFFFIGIGASYFFANHRFIENKNNFLSEIELLNSKYNDKELSYQELQRKNLELNGKIFQLLFTYFGIDLRDMEISKFNTAKESKEAMSAPKVIEKIVYIKEDKPQEETKEDKSNKNDEKIDKIMGINITDFISGSLPVIAKSNEFELLKRYKKLIAHKKNGPRYTLELDLQYKVIKKQYSGIFKITYSLLNKDDETLITNGAPVNFVTNYRLPGFIGIWLDSNRLILLNTNKNVVNTDPRGLVLLRNQYSVFEIESLLNTKNRFSYER